MHKTQVFAPPLSTVFPPSKSASFAQRENWSLAPQQQCSFPVQGDHFRTRLTHTLEVAQTSRTIARALRLNEDLTEAIALGHDLGHSPFGHDGEEVLDELLPGFLHNEQSVRVVELIERGGAGLNLTEEVIDGILNHPLSCSPSTLEGGVVRIADKIAYINHDIDDAIRAGILYKTDLPGDACAMLGQTSGERIDFLVRDIIKSSMGKPELTMNPDVYGAMLELYDFMYEHVYRGDEKMKQHIKIIPIITQLFEFFIENTDKMPDEYTQMIACGETSRRCVCDYIAGMTDRFALRTYHDIVLLYT
jgi:dGTPase